MTWRGETSVLSLADLQLEEEQVQATARQEVERNAADVVAQRAALEKKFAPDSTDADVRQYLEELGAATTTLQSLSFQDEADFAPSCGDRAAHGYNSGMGEIFRRVAAINPIDAQCVAPGC